MEVRELTDEEQVALCSLRADEWRATKFFGEVCDRLVAEDLAECDDGKYRLTSVGDKLATKLRKKRRHRSRG